MSKFGPCVAKGCDRDAEHPRSGFCHRCYQRNYRSDNPGVDRRKKENREKFPKPTDPKRCTRCRQYKERSEYYTNANGNSLPMCKPCHSDYNRARRIQAKLDNPPKPREKVDHGPCAFEGCVNKARNRYKGVGEWYCAAHTNQLYAGKELAPLNERRKALIDGVEGYLRCTACDQVKPETQFNMHSSGYRQGRCMRCYNLTNQFTKMVRDGRPEDAVRLTERMPERLANKYRTKYPHVFNGTGR